MPRSPPSVSLPSPCSAAARSELISRRLELNHPDAHAPGCFIFWNERAEQLRVHTKTRVDHCPHYSHRSVAPPSTPTERVVFEQTFEGLFITGLRARMSPALVAALKAEGLDVTQKLRPAYPTEVWTKCCLTAAKHLHPQEPVEVGLRLLGESVVEGFANGFLGRALFGVVRVLGPNRALARARQNFRSGNNYSDATVTKLENGVHELWMNERGPTRYVCQGIVLAALREMGTPEPKVEVARFDDEAVWFHVTWKLS